MYWCITIWWYAHTYVTKWINNNKLEWIILKVAEKITSPGKNIDQLIFVNKFNSRKHSFLSDIIKEITSEHSHIKLIDSFCNLCRIISFHCSFCNHLIILIFKWITQQVSIKVQSLQNAQKQLIRKSPLFWHSITPTQCLFLCLVVI